MSNIQNPICQFQNCNRVANYRKLKAGNCHLKDTKYEFCGCHRPINSINKKFPYKTIFDKINIELKYYNHQNEYILYEYHGYIYKLLKIINLNFQLKLQLLLKFFFTDIDYNLPINVNVSNITNYKNYFDKDIVPKIDIYNIIFNFKSFKNIIIKRKLKCYIFI